MGVNFDRRQMIQLGTFGLGAMGWGVMSASASAAMLNAKGFTHGVASGEPGATSVLLWTRYAAAQETQLVAEMSSSPDFAKADMVGSISASPSRDFTAKLVVNDLDPDSWYYYRFIGPDGTQSATGRTRTLPEGPTQKFNLGVFGCSNLPFGYFNAYAHAAERDDLDLVIHTGDYLYEYPVGTYPSKEAALAGRAIDPADEIVQLADYRLRYGAYRRDPDLQRIHQNFPMLAMWDDHEFTNDAYQDGAQNHQPKTEGEWGVRKYAAEQAYREWMPVRDLEPGEPRWSEYQIGDLATIFQTESRISARDKPADLAAAIGGQEDVSAALTKFRDGEWQDPSRQMLGAKQEAWLADAMRRSKASGTKWQVWAQQTIMGEMKLPQDATKWVSEDAPAIARSRVGVGALAAKLGLPLNFDSWDGYPQARKRALTAAQEAEADLIVLSGDSHNAWAFDLSTDAGAAGVEFAGHSVTSPGFEAYTVGVDPAVVAKAVIADNAQLQWAETGSRGYMMVSLTPEQTTSSWVFMDTIREKSQVVKSVKSETVERDVRRLANILSS